MIDDPSTTLTDNNDEVAQRTDVMLRHDREVMKGNRVRRVEKGGDNVIVLGRRRSVSTLYEADALGAGWGHSPKGDSVAQRKLAGEGEEHTQKSAREGHQETGKLLRGNNNGICPAAFADRTSWIGLAAGHSPVAARDTWHFARHDRVKCFTKAKA
ncbi:hypothetical protein LTR74_001339 [Friedmanniomyces endolithicus]|nr:hypothetical protein LTR74_001339 [Friedmanniomyces endolithicus]